MNTKDFDRNFDFEIPNSTIELSGCCTPRESASVLSLFTFKPEHCSNPGGDRSKAWDRETMFSQLARRSSQNVNSGVRHNKYSHGRSTYLK